MIEYLYPHMVQEYYVEKIVFESRPSLFITANLYIPHLSSRQDPVQSWPFSVMPVNILNHFDLPDCYRALAAKNLLLVSPWNSQMRLWNNKTLIAHAKTLGIELRRNQK